MKRKIAIRKKKQNRLGMFLVSTVVLMLLVVVAFKSMDLRQKQKSTEVRISELKSQIEQEDKRAEELAEFKKYTKTKKYAEEVAKDKLGLVYQNEILFKLDE